MTDTPPRAARSVISNLSVCEYGEVFYGDVAQ